MTTQRAAPSIARLITLAYPMQLQANYSVTNFVRRAAHGVRREPPMERAMKLTSAQIERTLSQFEAEAIPDSHPALPRLNELFGDHTFFLDSKGLNIVEPTAEPTGGRTQVARVVNVANWSDANTSDLAAHEPEPTDAIVELETKH